mmetsp:Transcript_10357/g.14280  ORF Transcript_10357/g.14280 Transcript_10357/m.14280 type:complete len:141 (-) Transcript_10357:1682-2104(-)
MLEQQHTSRRMLETTALHNSGKNKCLTNVPMIYNIKCLQTSYAQAHCLTSFVIRVGKSVVIPRPSIILGFICNRHLKRTRFSLRNTMTVDTARSLISVQSIDGLYFFRGEIKIEDVVVLLNAILRGGAGEGHDAALHHPF